MAKMEPEDQQTATELPKQSAATSEPWTDILLNATVAFMLEFAPRADVAKALQDLANRVSAGDTIRPVRSTDVDTMAKVTRLVYDWVHDPSTTAGDPAKPKPLWLTHGTPTLAELISKHLPDDSVEAGLRWMEWANVITLCPDGSYVLTRQMNLVLVGPDISLAVERFATNVTRLFWSGLRNLKSAANQSARNLDREARVTHLPERYAPAFLAFAKESAQAFLSVIDNYLESHDDPSTSEPTLEAGMHVYTWLGSPTTGPRARASFDSTDSQANQPRSNASAKQPPRT